MSASDRSSRKVGSGFSRTTTTEPEFSQGVGSNPVPVAIMIKPPAYSLFPFTDPFGDEDQWFTPRFPPLPVPLGFGLIGQPGSLPEPRCHPVRSVAPADFPVEKILTVGSTPVVPVGQEPSSSVVLSSADRVDAGVSSPGSVQSNRSFYSAVNSLTHHALVIRHSHDSGQPCCREGPFIPASPHPRIGDDTGSCAYRYTTYREADFVNHDVRFGLPIHHPRFLKWVGAPELAWLLYRDYGDWIRSRSQSRAKP